MESLTALDLTDGPIPALLCRYRLTKWTVAMGFALYAVFVVVFLMSLL